MVIDFGNMYYLYTYLRREGLTAALDTIGYLDPVTLYVMGRHSSWRHDDVSHGRLAGGEFCQDPVSKGKPGQPEDRRFFTDMGKERSLRGFFSEYVPYMGKQVSKRTNILIEQYRVAGRHPLSFDRRQQS
ncbi:MAG: hypothetical protein LBP92_09970 [Deltaproteobacteria bacterium]|nr:hypothetical protein [Deltaproteobacteria bacterium]